VVVLIVVLIVLSSGGLRLVTGRREHCALRA